MKIVKLLLVSAVLCSVVLAQPPRVTNATVQSRSAAGGLDVTFRALVTAQESPGWIGYAVPMVPGHQSCCFNSSQSCCSGCSLESRTGTFAAAERSPVRLEGSTHLVVLFRVAQKAVGKVRTFSGDCELDAGSVAFHWLTDVRVNESLALLERFASANESDSESRRVAENSVSAIALHSDPGADAALERLSASGRRENVRRQAIFWMGNARGRRGYDQLIRILREDPGDKIREHAIFALTQSKEPEAVRTIISVAREDKSAHVRGQALFWLAQKAGREATAAINEAIENDPETEVKRRAVFALSQLPKDEGVPMLIQVARSNRNPAVRKQAMFWLGQSKDTRAVKFFEDVLTR